MLLFLQTYTEIQLLFQYFAKSHRDWTRKEEKRAVGKKKIFVYENFFFVLNEERKEKNVEFMLSRD